MHDPESGDLPENDARCLEDREGWVRMMEKSATSIGVDFFVFIEWCW